MGLFLTFDSKLVLEKPTLVKESRASTYRLVEHSRTEKGDSF